MIVFFFFAFLKIHRQRTKVKVMIYILYDSLLLSYLSGKGELFQGAIVCDRKIHRKCFFFFFFLFSYVARKFIYRNKSSESGTWVFYFNLFNFFLYIHLKMYIHMKVLLFSFFSIMLRTIFMTFGRILFNFAFIACKIHRMNYLLWFYEEKKTLIKVYSAPNCLS